MGERKMDLAGVSMRQVSDCQDLIDRHCAGSLHTQFVCVTSVDGRLLAVGGERERSAAQRYSAISSSLLGLAESFSREALQDRARYNLVASAQGSIVVVRIPSPSTRFALALCADNSETVALALRNALDLSEAAARLLP